MRKQTINIYGIEELAESPKELALDNLREFFLCAEWYSYVYDDAKEIDLNITSFDIDHKLISAEFIYSPQDTAEAIIRNHGESCKTYTHAKAYMSGEYKKSGQSDNDFLFDLRECYLEMLVNEWECLNTEESLIENAQANGYEFLSSGELYHE